MQDQEKEYKLFSSLDESAQILHVHVTESRKGGNPLTSHHSGIAPYHLGPVLQPWHYCHFGPDNSLLWRTMHYRMFRAYLAFTLYLPTASPPPLVTTTGTVPRAFQMLLESGRCWEPLM